MFEVDRSGEPAQPPGSRCDVSTAEVAGASALTVAGVQAMRRSLTRFALSGAGSAEDSAAASAEAEDSTALAPHSQATAPPETAAAQSETASEPPVTANAQRIDLLRDLEELSGAIASAQARLAAELDAETRAERADRGIAAERRGAGVAAQVALARRVSPVRGTQYLGLAKALTAEMPHTLSALAHGHLNEWRATLLVRESACLTVADRAAFDAELCAEPDRFASWGDKRFIAEARALTARLDQAALVRRAARAEADRRVTIRPAPDTMAQVTALLPVAQGVAVHAALVRRADELRAQGDERSKGQIMADTLVERVTGRTSAERCQVEVQLVMTDRSLLNNADDPAFMPGHGVVPARWARNLVARANTATDDSSELGAWIRQLFTPPGGTRLVAMESRSRMAPPGLAQFITARDRTCRTPWCDAPIRHIDHVTPSADGGRTEAENLQGLCEACNYAKEANGWRSRAVRSRADAVHTVTVETPTGHSYSSQPPSPPGGWRRHRRRVPGFVCTPLRLGRHDALEISTAAA